MSYFWMEGILSALYMKVRKELLTLIICTRNRANILSECLPTFFKQSVPPGLYQVLIVDNASEDETVRLVKEQQQSYANLQYFLEPKTGLSRARNSGWRHVDTKWIGYIDDDAKVPENFVERALNMINNYQFDCFGGTYYAWYKYGKPSWLSEDFGNKPIIRDAIGEIPEDLYLSGSCFFLKREVFMDIGGFDLRLGMTEKTGFAEESELQMRLRGKGFRIGYDPDLYIEHCVMPHKLKVWWHLEAAYKRGLASQLSVQPLSWTSLLYRFGRTIATALLFKIPRGFLKSMVCSKFYWQNMLLEAFEYPLNYLGHLLAKISEKMK